MLLMVVQMLHCVTAAAGYLFSYWSQLEGHAHLFLPLYILLVLLLTFDLLCGLCFFVVVVFFVR